MSQRLSQEIVAKTTTEKDTVDQQVVTVDSGSTSTTQVNAVMLHSTSVLSQVVTTYEYDGLDRLQGEVNNTAAMSYTYDLVGNRTSQWVDGLVAGTYQYDAANQVISWSDPNQVINWSYDPVGNLLSDGSQSYTYDALNRLTSVNNGLTLSTYYYNGDNDLTVRTRDGAHTDATYYTQDSANPLSTILYTADRNRNSTKEPTSFVYGIGNEQLFAAQGATRTWSARDALGTPKLSFDDAGDYLSHTRFDAWGNPVDGAPVHEMGFTGELQDSVTGLVYHPQGSRRPLVPSCHRHIGPAGTPPRPLRRLPEHPLQPAPVPVWLQQSSIVYRSEWDVWYPARIRTLRSKRRPRRQLSRCEFARS